jgi:hypothetical protein
MQGAAYRRTGRPRHARRPTLWSPRSWGAVRSGTARKLPRHWTRQGIATAAGLAFSTAALITSIVVAITMQPSPSDVPGEAIAPPAVPAIPLPASSPSRPVRHRHVSPRRTVSGVPVPASAVSAAAPRPPVIRHGKPAVFPATLVLDGTRVGQLTVTASGGSVRWSASAFGVSLSAWSGTLAAGQSEIIVVSALNAGGTGWVRIEPDGLYVPVTWTATPSQPSFPY